jgi:hypothetical protein
VRGSKELEIVLNHTTTAWSDFSNQRRDLSVFCDQLARLKLAIQLRQKRVINHFTVLSICSCLVCCTSKLSTITCWHLVRRIV